MLSQDLAAPTKPAQAAPTGDADNPHLPLELLELELSLEGFAGGEQGFRAGVETAIAAGYAADVALGDGLPASVIAERASVWASGVV